MKSLKPIATSFLALALAACASIGPDFKPPAPPTASRYTEAPMSGETAAAPGVRDGAAQRFVAGGELRAEWWSLFQSPALEQLIRQALALNPTLVSAQATLRQARENLAAERGTLLYPGVDLNASVTREKSSGASFGQPAFGNNIFTLYNTSVNVTYALDVVGGGRRQLEGLQALVDFQNYQLEGARLALVANIVTAAVREAALRAQIAATMEIIAAEEKQLQLVQRQFELGAVARLSVLTLASQLAQTRATYPPLEKALAQTRHLLATLSGGLPSEASVPVFDLDSLQLPQELPLSVPSQLARQRPDIRAAEAMLHQANAAVGRATADLYPKINLSAGVSLLATRVSDMFAGPPLWSLVAGLTQPLFHGGALDARKRAAIAAYDAALAQYQQTVLTGFQNVADSLRALEADARELAALAEAERASSSALDLTRQQFQLGGTNVLALLIAQEQYQRARLGVAAARGNRYADTVALFQALGGGWWQETSAQD